MTEFLHTALIEGALDAIWLIDPIDLRVLHANRGAEQLLGVEPGAYIGMPVSHLAATPEDIFFWEDAAAGLSSHIRSETLFKHSDGHTLPVERSVTRVIGPEGVSIFVMAVRDRSEQHQVAAEMEQLIAELRATLESTADGIMVVDPVGAIRSYNHRFAELWDLPNELTAERNDAAVYGWMAQNVLNPEHYAARLAVIVESPLLEGDDILFLRNGRVLERHTLPQYARGRPIGRVYSFHDITRRLADEQRLTLAAQVFESSLDAIFVTDPELHVISANPAAQALVQLSGSELSGYALGAQLHNEHGVDLSAHMLTQLQETGSWEGEVSHVAHDGQRVPVLVSAVRVADDKQRTQHYIVFFKDLTESLAAKQRIEELAYNDVLTGLPNRLLLAERIQFSLRVAEREGQPFGVLFVDLDRFKQINDSLGHQFGDRVLIEVACRIKGCLRQADTAARLGGDEFVLLLHHTDALGAEITARRILDALCLPFQVDELQFNLSCSIGIAMFPDDGTTMDDLIKNADSAMYHVKERGRSDFRFYQRQMNIDLLARMKLDHAMRRTLESDGFRLAYQPQVDLVDGRVSGAEALLRWHHADLGDVPPARFIPVAEETGVIVPIGNWVLREAVRQGAQWLSQGQQLMIAVNVSALQFRQIDFIEAVAAVLREFEFPPGLLELELTESILIQDATEVARRLDSLAKLGVRLAIDDFGTGYSSLAYLKQLPLHRLKIDRSFISDLPGDESNAAIVIAIVNMARALGLRIIAEGVETSAQRDFLQGVGCHEYQGYLCAPAVPASDFFSRSAAR